MENNENNERYKELSHQIDEWLETFDAPFDTEKIWRQFNVITRKGKQNVWTALDERVKRGDLDFKFGRYRKIDKTRKVLNFRGVNTKNFVPVKFPKSLLGNTSFELEGLVRLFPKSIVVVAGTKGGAKTAFMLNIARECMNNPELSKYFCDSSGCQPYTEEPMVAYFTNELSDEEFTDRLECFEDDMSMWNLIAEERYSNFADAIYPDKINLIDALEQNTEAYIVADLIDAIHQKLDKGIAIIAMHKNFNAEYAAGGIYSAKKARLYLILQGNILKVKHAKKTVDGQTAEGKAWSFQLVNGAKFTNIIPYYGDE